MFTQSWEISFKHLLSVNVYLSNKDFLWTSDTLILIASYSLEVECLSEKLFLSEVYAK